MQKPKTLSQLKKTIQQKKGESGSGAYYPKGKDEQDFVDKHEIEMTDDANGNDDEVFKASKVKVAKRADENHGYDKDKDDDVYEEVTEMSDSEKKKAETIVKGMKKNMSSFKKQYGKDAESVMYATANKLAQEEVEESDDVDTALLELYADLTSDNKLIMEQMLEEGLQDELLEALKEEEQNG